MVDDYEVAEAKKQGNSCLIGKIWAGKRVNRDGFITMFRESGEQREKLDLRRFNPTYGFSNSAKSGTR